MSLRTSGEGSTRPTACGLRCTLRAPAGVRVGTGLALYGRRAAPGSYNVPPGDSSAIIVILSLSSS